MLARSGSPKFIPNFPAGPVWLSTHHPHRSFSQITRPNPIHLSGCLTVNEKLRLTSTRWPTRRTFAVKANLPSPSSDPLFNYTSGLWLYNKDLRLEERTRFFNVDELCRLAAESVGRRLDDVASLKKLAEGGFNRTFLITMHDGFQMVGRIPYPVTVPKPFVIASEVATMVFLRSRGLPIPEIFDYSLRPDNAAGTEYIFMAYVDGDSLDDIWHDLTEDQTDSFFRQFTEIEAKMMSISFPAGGSLYFTEDLKTMLAGSSSVPGILLEDDRRFCVGPDTSVPLWYGRRSELNLGRGPYASAEAALEGVAKKELAFLQKFGQPLLPFQRERREAYGYEKQSQWDHVENLLRYLSIASSLVPRNSDLRRFCIRHFDAQLGNFIVLRQPDSNDLRIIAIIDFQHTPILPMFLLAGVPQALRNYDDLYLENTAKYNEPHHAALEDPMGALRRLLFFHARNPWEGETLALKVALIKLTENWKTLVGEGLPCPIEFDPADVGKTMALHAEQKKADRNLQMLQNLIGFVSEGWVPIEHYEEAKARSEELKRKALELAETEKERNEIMENWPLDDMDENDYM
ncbi:protein kinase subdomain-containing protein PKL/CAK/Fmp29 [Pisolithus albus]|nr:protein kinase subdomain-containing protein PKL/CAK/Fmp29 [Pisolithus albus]